MRHKLACVLCVLVVVAVLILAAVVSAEPPNPDNPHAVKIIDCDTLAACWFPDTGGVACVSIIGSPAGERCEAGQ